MHHLFAKLAGVDYYICSMDSEDNAHIKGVSELYSHLYSNAEFKILKFHIGPITFSSFKSCLDFVKKYKALYFQNETIGA